MRLLCFSEIHLFLCTFISVGVTLEVTYDKMDLVNKDSPEGSMLSECYRPVIIKGSVSLLNHYDYLDVVLIF